jgi:hypothetical protein
LIDCWKIGFQRGSTTYRLKILRVGGTLFLTGFATYFLATRF